MLKEKVSTLIQKFRDVRGDDAIWDIFNQLCDLVIGENNDEIKQDNAFCRSVLIVLTDIESALRESLYKTYVKAFRFIYADDKAGYFSAIEQYIQQFKERRGDFTCEKAYSDILDIISRFSKDDPTYNTYIRKLSNILKEHMPQSAFCAYVIYLTKAYQNKNVEIKVLRQILEIDPGWYAAHVHLGDAYFNQKNWREAIACYETALESGELWKTAQVYFWIAYCYDKTKQYEKSVEYYNMCLEISPDDHYANSNIAYVFRKMKDYDKALRHVDKSIASEGIDSFSFQIKVEALVGAGKKDEAAAFAKEYPKYAGAKHISNLLEKATGGQTDLDTNVEQEKATPNTHAGTITIKEGDGGLPLYEHQKDAIRDMSRKILNKDKYSGLLVLPTGGGKTLTATYWLMGNILDNGHRVIWLAHRHELLNQARSGFENVSWTSIAHRKKQYNFRLVSGQHDKPVHIRQTDDVIIASKTSLHRGFSHLLEKWLSDKSRDVFLVIDEAHHATAKEYRELISQIREASPEVKVLGLTATPFRTADNEQGLLKKIFYDDIAYKIDLRELISRGILAEPIFKEVNTEFDMLRLFQTPDGSAVLARIEQDSFFDIESIGEKIANDIADNTERNNVIVKEYVNNKKKYGKTLVFALNVTMAIALNKVFREHGVKSDYVVSDIKDAVTGVTLSSKENTEKIQRFRDEVNENNDALEVFVACRAGCPRMSNAA